MSNKAIEGKTLLDEEWRKLLKPTPTVADVLKILQKSFISSDEQSCSVVQQLDSYDDCNFKVEIDGEPYLIKVHNGVESRDFLKVYEEAGRDFHKRGHSSSVIHFQYAISNALTSNGIATSNIIPPIGSRAPVVIENLPVMSAEHSPTKLVVKLMTWLHGRTMSTIQMLPLEVLADAGRTLGRMHTALDQLTPDTPYEKLRKRESEIFLSTLSWTNILSNADSVESKTSLSRSSSAIPEKDSQNIDGSIWIAARRYHQWDGKNTADVRKFTWCIPDGKRRGLVESVIDAFEAQLSKASFRRGINHGDFNDANIMVDQDLKVSGVIDFGDSVESWRVLDISVAMTYAMLSSYGKSNRSISAAAAMLRGYNAEYPLLGNERQYLVLLIACRLSCSVTLGAYSYQHDPSNKYLLLHSEPAWKALELIWGYDTDKRAKMTTAVDRVFQQACLYTDKRDAIITCFDLVLPDPSVADLLQSVRVPCMDVCEDEVSRKKRKAGVISSNGTKAVITFVTGNAEKLEEVRRILAIDDELSSMPFKLVYADIELPELQGEALNVAREKAALASEEVGGAVIVEDTSLCFNALNGMPGVFVKWFLESCGLEGLNKIIEGYPDKSAYAQTVVALAPGPGQDPVMFVGRTAGKIVMPRGSLDFGWDPIFEADEGNGKTYAEMSKEEKDAISHRSRAFQQLRDYIRQFQDDLLSKIEDV